MMTTLRPRRRGSDPGLHRAMGGLGRTQGDAVIVWAGRVLVGGGTLAIWQWSPELFGVNPFWFSRPSLVWATARAMAADGSLGTHLGVTVVETLIGLALGCAFGIAIGLVLGRVRVLRELFEPFLLLANALPKIAMAPLFMLWFGVGLALKVAVAFSLVAVVMTLSTYAGMRVVRQELVSSTRLMGATEAQIFRKVVLPSITPWLFAGFRVSVGFALIGAVLGEFIAAQGGLGFMIDNGLGTFDSSLVFLGLVLLLILSWGINTAVDVVGRRIGGPAATPGNYLS